MSRGVPSYYPPRARWYSPFLGAGALIRRRLALDRVRLPAGVSIAGVLASVLLPGVGFYLRGPRFWGRIAMSVSAFLVFLIAAWFGFPSASVAFGLLLSIHTCGLAFLFDPLMHGARFRTRLLFGLSILVALGGLVYLPARNFIQDHWFIPLRVNGHVVIVRRQPPTAALQRGDCVAYSLEGFTQHELIVHSGFGLGPVLALPGDQVRFTKSAFEVNGIAQPRLALMPETGDWIVPGKHWFVWPQLARSGHGQTDEGALSETILALSTISKDQFLGKPPRHWLWRRQF